VQVYWISRDLRHSVFGYTLHCGRYTGRRRVDFNGNRAVRGHQEGYAEPSKTILVLNEHLIPREEFSIGSWGTIACVPRLTGPKGPQLSVVQVTQRVPALSRPTNLGFNYRRLPEQNARQLWRILRWVILD
jgi:hypothetical protein